MAHRNSPKMSKNRKPALGTLRNRGLKKLLGKKERKETPARSSDEDAVAWPQPGKVQAPSSLGESRSRPGSMRIRSASVNQGGKLRLEEFASRSSREISAVSTPERLDSSSQLEPMRFEVETREDEGEQVALEPVEDAAQFHTFDSFEDELARSQRESAGTVLSSLYNEESERLFLAKLDTISMQELRRAAIEPEMSVVEFDVVQAVLSFYSRPWQSIFYRRPSFTIEPAPHNSTRGWVRVRRHDSKMSLPRPAKSNKLVMAPLGSNKKQRSLLSLKEHHKIAPQRALFSPPAIPFQASDGVSHFVVSVTQASVEALQEPVMASLAIFDRKFQRKLTGDFVVPFPSGLKLSELPPWLENAADPPRRAIFSASSVTPDVFFVFRFYKLWRSPTSRYTISELLSMTADERESYNRDTRRLFTAELDSLNWECFGFAFYPLLEASSSISQGAKKGSIKFDAVYELPEACNNDEFFYAALNAAVAGEVPKHNAAALPRINGSITCSFRPDTTHEVHGADGLEVIEMFDLTTNVNISCVNDLYLYPKRLGGPLCTSRSVLQLSVSFVASDLSSEPPLLLMCALVTAGELKRVFEIRSCVGRAQHQYADFHDEIRLQLPLVLEPSARLIFQVKQLRDAEQSAEHVASSSLALFKGERFLEDGMHSISLESAAGTSSFQFMLRFVSSVYAKDEHFARTLSGISRASLDSQSGAASFRDALAAIQLIPRPVEAANFPVLLSSLFELLTVHSLEEVAEDSILLAFGELLSIIDRLHNTFPSTDAGPHPMLLSYVTYVFSPPLPNFHETFVSLWLLALRKELMVEFMAPCRSWLLLEVVMKSLLLSKPSMLEEDALSGGGNGGDGNDNSTPSQRNPARMISNSLLSALDDLSAGASPSRTSQRSASGGDAKSRKPRKTTSLVRGEPEVSSSGFGTVNAEPRELSERFREELAELLGRLLSVSAATEDAALRRSSMQDVAKFVRTLFYVADRGFALNMVQYCVTIMEDFEWFELLPTFLYVIFDTPEYVLLNLPQEAEELSSIKEYLEVSGTQHPLIGILMDLLRKELQRESSSRIILVLHAMLSKHDRELREEPEVLERVIAMYFPFILLCMSSAQTTLQRLEHGDKKALPWLLCFLYILEKAPARLVEEWWTAESVVGINQFFDFLIRCCKRVSNTNKLQQVHRVVLDVLLQFASWLSSPRDADLHKSRYTSTRLVRGGPHASKFFALLEFLFNADAEEPLSVSFAQQLFPAAEKIALALQAPLFKERKTPYCQMVAYPAIAHCNSANAEVRELSAHFLYKLIEVNYKLHQTFSQMKLACTIATSRLITTHKGGDMTGLRSSLSSVVEMSAGNAELQRGIQEMVSRLFSVLESSRELNDFDDVPEMKVDICYRISDGYARSPDLRITWLKIIGDYHKKQRRYEEAAQAYLVVAYLILQYLQQSGSQIACDAKDLTSIAPCLSGSGNEFELTADDLANKAALRMAIWKVNGLSDTLEKAASMLTDAKEFEAALTAFNVLIALHKPLGNYLALLQAYSGAQMCCKQFLKEGKDKKQEPKYFRVAFAGKGFEKHKHNGKAFIYKEPMSTRLMDFKDRIVGQFTKHLALYNAKRVEHLGNDKTVTPQMHEDSDVLYVQIARVQPVWPNGIPAFSIDTFVLDLAHSDERKNQQAVAMQGRKKMFYTVRTPFPNFQTRIPIVETRSVILSPIENAIELMKERTAALRTAVSTNPPSATVISGILYGNLMTAVAEGPEAVAEAFLKPTLPPAAHRKAEARKSIGPGFDDGEAKDDAALRLLQLMNDFISLTQKALDTHEEIMPSNMREWQDTARTRFATLKGKLAPYGVGVAEGGPEEGGPEEGRGRGE